MQFQIRSIFIKCGILIFWVCSVFYYVIVGNIASILFVWTASIMTVVAYFVTVCKDKKNDKAGRWIFFLLVGGSVFINAWDFLEMIWIDSTIEVRMVDKEVVDEWLSSNVEQTLGYSLIVLLGYIFPIKMLNRQSRLIVFVTTIFMLISIVISLGGLVLHDTFAGSAWRKWVDYAWAIQVLYFHSTIVCLGVVLVDFLYRNCHVKEYM